MLLMRNVIAGIVGEVQWFGRRIILADLLSDPSSEAHGGLSHLWRISDSRRC